MVTLHNKLTDATNARSQGWKVKDHPGRISGLFLAPTRSIDLLNRTGPGNATIKSKTMRNKGYTYLIRELLAP